MFRDAEIEQLLDARARDGERPGQIAKRDLGRYYALLADALPGVTAELSMVQLRLLYSLHEGATWGLRDADRIWAEVLAADAKLFEEFQVDQEQLVRTLRTFTVIERLALVDALERMWLAPPEVQAQGRIAVLRSVGLA